MPSFIHTTIVDLLEAHPEVLSYLLGLQGATPPPEQFVPTEGTTSQTFTFERRVDGAFLIGPPEKPRGFALVEAQLRRNDNKLFAWALYWELARSRYRCEGALVVLTVSARVRRWIERRVVRRTGQFGAWRQIRPIVVALDEIAPDLLLRPEMPYLAPLAVAGHARSPEAAEIAARAVDLTTERLPEDLAFAQLDVILAMVDAGLREALEKRMLKKHGYRSEFFRRLEAEAIAKVSDGIRAEGVAEGVAKGRAAAILDILESRGIPASDRIRAKILGCTDLETLQRWQTRALVATSASAVVREEPLSKAAPQPATRAASGGGSPSRSARSAAGKRTQPAKQPA